MTTSYDMPPIRAREAEQDAPPTPVTPVAVPKPSVAAKAKGGIGGFIAAERDKARKNRAIWKEHPPSLGDLAKGIEHGKWATSEVGLKKAVALIDGYLVVIPWTAVCYVAAWIGQTFPRRMVALIFLVIILVTLF